MAVFGELDKHKNSDNSLIANNARKFIRMLDKLGKEGSLYEGVEFRSSKDFCKEIGMKCGGTLKISNKHHKIDSALSPNDNIIIGTCLYHHYGEDYKGIENLNENLKFWDGLVLLTNDTNMKIIAREYGILTAGMHLKQIN